MVSGRTAIILGALWLTGSLTPAVAAEPPAKPISATEYRLLVNRTDYAAHTIGVTRFLELMHTPKTTILDLRDAEAYAKSHIKGARHLGAAIDADKIAKLAPDKTAPILLYCANALQPTRMISQTTIALPQFLALGYKRVYLLKDAADNRGSSIAPDMRLIARLPLVTDPPPATATPTGPVKK